MGRINIGHKDHPKRNRKESHLIEPKIIYVDREVEVIVEKPVPYEVEKLVHVDRIVEKIVNVEVEKLVHVDREVPVEREVQVVVEKMVPYEVEKIVNVVVEKPVPYEVEKIVYVDRDREVIVEKPVHYEVEKIIHAEPIIIQNFELQKELEDLKHQLAYEGANLAKSRQKNITDAKRKQSLMASLRKQKDKASKIEFKLKLAIAASVILPLIVFIIK